MQIEIYDGIGRAYDLEVWEIVGDFLKYCDGPSRPVMDRGGGVDTDPMHTVGAYKEMERWLYGTSAPTDDPTAVFNPRNGGKEDAVRICKRYLHNKSYWYISCGEEIASETMGKASAERDDVFAGVMKWIIDDLDAHYGFDYINKDIFGRDVWTKHIGVRQTLKEMREESAQERFDQASMRVRVPTESSSSDSSAGGDLDRSIDSDYGADERSRDTIELTVV